MPEIAAQKPEVSCSQCGATNLGFQKRCLLCHSPLPSPTPRVCRYCHRTNVGFQTACLACHAPLPPLELSQPDHQGFAKHAPAQGRRHCPNPECMQEVGADQKFCSNCGWSLTQEHAKETPRPKPRRVCPNPECGKPAKKNDKFCTACGHQLS